MVALIAIVTICFCVTIKETIGQRCDDVRGHRNIHLLPVNPNCGRVSFVGETKYVSGVPVRPGEFPWLVDLQLFRMRRGRSCDLWNDCKDWDWEYLKQCNGVIINHLYVLTTTSCLDQGTVSNIFKKIRVLVKRGGTVRDSLKVGFDVTEVVKHDDADDDGFNDIALIRLRSTIEFNERVQPICLPLTCNKQLKSLECFELLFAAWGNTTESAEIAKKFLVEMTSCVNIAGTSTTQLCGTGVPPSFIYGRDTGGPLMLGEFVRGKFTYYLMGILRVQRYFQRTKFPFAVFTRVTHFLRWILENIKPWNAPDLLVPDYWIAG